MIADRVPETFSYGEKGRMSLARKFLASAACCVMLVGCSEEAEEVVKPVAFEAHDRCILCGMVIAHYPGPKAEVFIKGADGEAVKFCSGRDAFTFALQPENARRLLGFFIHDMGTTDWDYPSDSALMDATKAVYVYGHDVEGVMGNEPAAFSTQEKAQEFIQKHGGKLYAYKDVTLELLDK